MYKTSEVARKHAMRIALRAITRPCDEEKVRRCSNLLGRLNTTMEASGQSDMDEDEVVQMA